MVWLKDKKARQNLLLISLGLIALALLISVWPGRRYDVKAGNCLFKSEGALSAEKQHRGLSGRKALADDEGMLFLFAEKTDRTFVMRNMLFPLDIVFISDNRVINIYNDLPAEGNDPQTTYHSGAPVNAALEIPAGRARECGIGVGSQVTW